MIEFFFRVYLMQEITFAFKPRFKVKNDSLYLVKNIIDHESKFEKYQNFIHEIKKDDFFYEKKFKKEIIKFPFTYSVSKNVRRNIPILFWSFGLKSGHMLVPSKGIRFSCIKQLNQKAPWFHKARSSISRCTTH